MSNQGSYTDTRKRMEDILIQVRSKDVPLEKSLDLYEEALAIGARCADLIDSTDFAEEELEGESENSTPALHESTAAQDEGAV